MTPTVRDLIAGGCLNATRLIGGADGLDRQVNDLHITSLGHSGPFGVGQLCAVPVSRRQATSPAVDVLVRRLVDAGAAGLVLCESVDEATFATATARVADRFGLPVFHSPQRTHELAVELTLWIRHPTAQSAHRIAEITRALRDGEGSLGAISSTLTHLLPATVCVLGTDNTLMAGTRPPQRLPWELGGQEVVVGSLDEGGFVAHPVRGPGGTIELWLVACHDHAGELWRHCATQTLAVAELAVRAWTATTRLTAEREARHRTDLLDQILGHGDDLPPHVASHAARMGWNLTGWNTGLHFLRINGEHDRADVSAATALRTALGRAGIDIGDLVPRDDGWSAWVAAQRPPTPQSTATLTNAITHAVRGYTALRTTPDLVAGIGTAAPGPTGLSTSLHRAHRAASTISVRAIPGAVQHVDQLGATQMVTASLSAPALREALDGVLAPLYDDPNGNGEELVRTLTAYFRTDSVTAAAERLQVHRNTVNQRLDRIGQLLGADLSDPDVRLALRMACRNCGVPRSPAPPTKA